MHIPINKVGCRRSSTLDRSQQKGPSSYGIVPLFTDVSNRNVGIFNGFLTIVLFEDNVRNLIDIGLFERRPSRR